MNVRRGDIVLVHFPFSSGTGAKLRPALVIQSDHNNRRLSNTIVAMITSRYERAALEPTQLPISLATPDGEQSGLLHDSGVKCENLFTIERTLVRRTIGRLPETAMNRIDGCLKAALGIS